MATSSEFRRLLSDSAEKTVGMNSPETLDCSIEPLPSRFPVVFRSGGKKRGVIGVGALTHDTSAALVCLETGNVIYASAEERLSNKKHDSRFPIGAILRCCEVAAKHGFGVEKIAVNFDPRTFLPGVIGDELAVAGFDPDRISAFMLGLDQVINRGQPFDLSNDSACNREVAGHINKLDIVDSDFRRNLVLRLSWYLNVAIKYRRLGDLIERLFAGVPVRFVGHHHSHAASAFFGSAFEEAAVLVVDGHGESDTTTIYLGEKSGLHRVSQTLWPFSLGSIYLATTRYLGFDYGDEYKVMGMSAYGRPLYLDDLKSAVSVSEEGKIKILETAYFGIGGVRNTGHKRFEIREPFHGRCLPRQSGEEIRQHHFDLAASAQALVECLGVDLAKAACRLTGSDRLAIAGGVGLNGLMNEAIRRSGSVSDLFIYPAASDDGTSAGAALALLIESGVRPKSRMIDCYYGYQSAPGEIEEVLGSTQAIFSRPVSINRQIAEAVASGKIVARYTGGAEYGPRALGNRSILANPAIPGMKDVLNLRVKHREQFRPFAPACLREHVHEYFDVDTDAPFMIMIVRAKDSARKLLPSVVHNDGTARVQTVTETQNADFYRTICEFFAITGIPVMINTSFNVNGEAIVDTPLDAIESFAFMDIDYLALGDYWISKAENPELLGELSHDKYLEIRRQRYALRVTDPISKLDVRKYEPWFFPSSDNVSRFLKSLSIHMY